MNWKLSCAIALALFSEIAFAEQPPDVVYSDDSGNTASGSDALGILQGGSFNTAMGEEALSELPSGSNNTAVGYYALIGCCFKPQPPYFNNSTSVGSYSMSNAGISGNNTAIGFQAMQGEGAHDGDFGFTGSNNTASGMNSLQSIGSGSNNTASGYSAMSLLASGSSNTGLGASVLAASTTGNDNTAVGGAAMAHNVSGSNNVALGNNALKNDSAGNANVAIGYNAGDNLQGSNNVTIANVGNSSDSGVVRIGTAGTQASVYLAGVATTHVTGASVVVTSSGQLGVLASSERYKTEIETLSNRTEKLARLRPVSFHLKSEPTGPVQYGLIAEEVDKIYPELVIRDDKGAVQGVRYDELAPMLLKQVQQQATEIRELKEQFAQMRAAMERNAANGATLAELAAPAPGP